MTSCIVALCRAVIALLHIASVNALRRGDHEAVEELNYLENSIKANMPENQ